MARIMDEPQKYVRTATDKAVPVQTIPVKMVKEVKKTKLQEEMDAAKTTASNAISTLHTNIESQAPSWLKQLIDKILWHPGTPWFFLGMGVEALGLSVQFLFQGSSYPTMDVIFHS
jgi:hypothetical protein